MADLTQEDRENYDKLKTAFSKLNYSGTPIKEITTSANNEIQKALSNDTGELRKRVDLVDGYLKFHALLLPGKPEDVQEIKNLNEELNRSLKTVEDETLDLTEEIEDLCFDPLFIKFLDMVKSTDPNDTFTTWTNDLRNKRDPNLKEEQIDRLIKAWGSAVDLFVEDARILKLKNGNPDSSDIVMPGTQQAFSSFFCIHDELETLYSRLADTETVQR